MRIRDDAPRLGRAVAQGTVAAMAMTGMRAVTTALGLVVQPPPDAIAEQEAPRLIGRLPEPRRSVAKELVHWGYGAAGGAGYALLPEWIRRRRWAGVAYGMVAWLVFEAVLAPLLDLPHARERRVKEAFALAADHLLYGVVLGETDRFERRASRSERGIFTPSPTRRKVGRQAGRALGGARWSR